MNRLLFHVCLIAGLLAIAWVGFGYVAGNSIASVVLLLIAAVFILGAMELHRFHGASNGLSRALDATRSSPASLDEWLSPLQPGLREAVRLRVQGERVALPGPALTPYLVGLLVLLGMLGTFLGMVVTLKGTGVALESASDLDAIRSSLAAPIKGLGLAFGTSVAGVAASALLGLMSALARRERLSLARQLDGEIATNLREFSKSHQREQSMRLLKAQSDVMPELVAQVKALVTQVERQGQHFQDKVSAEQHRFYDEARSVYTELAASVDKSLRQSLSEGARLAAATIEPAIQATLAGLARESANVHESLASAVRQQLDGMATRLDGSAAVQAERWSTVLATLQEQSAGTTARLQSSLQNFTDTFEQRSASLLEAVQVQADRNADQWAKALADTLGQQRQASETLGAHAREHLLGAVKAVEEHSTNLLDRLSATHAAWDTQSAAREQQRMDAFHDGIARMSATLERTAGAITERAEVHAATTIGEITRLVRSATDAPRVAAEVMAELRQVLSDSLVRDNAALQERAHLMSTLNGLLDTLTRASTEQRTAIDALIQATTRELEDIQAHFSQTIEMRSLALASAAAQTSASAAEVASLGEGFAHSVVLFGNASEQLMAQLQRIESALSGSLARSDEQMAYYVAQAREIVDLTLGSQKQIVEDMQQLARAPASPVTARSNAR